MRHGEQIIVITTTEQAESVLEHLSQCKKSAKENNYASERKKPIKWMECCCCGESYQGRQWFNQDAGYGLGDCCVSYCNVDSAPGSESSSYGVSGIHFLISQEEKDIKEDNLWLMKGDCLERMEEIPDGSVDLILTDPPYGSNIVTGKQIGRAHV